MTEAVLMTPTALPKPASVKRVHFEELRPNASRSRFVARLKGATLSSKSSAVVHQSTQRYSPQFSADFTISFPPAPSKSAMKATTVRPAVFASHLNDEKSEDEREEVVDRMPLKREKSNKSKKPEPKVLEEEIVVRRVEEREEPKQPEPNGVTPELIKKLQSLKPLIDTAKDNIHAEEAKNRKNEKSPTTKKNSNSGSVNKETNTNDRNNSSVYTYEKEVRNEQHNHSNGRHAELIEKKSDKTAKKTAKTVEPLVTENDSATAQVVLGPMRSKDPVSNALNFSVMQQQQKESPIEKSPTAKKSSMKK
ncbi:hypothetical protein M3Y94_00086200 [Aphelenchoides besseyi]|nr:hypothetical protein M3Y94_00086200 [Aphelenchoides besseyi]KAI6237731.1 hypothetical protein M3Y95_00295900 [Aphelenchoides besseyi]